MTPLVFLVLRDVCSVGCKASEGFSLGRIYADSSYIGFTLEDEDRRLEEGNEKVYGRTAIPLGRYKMSLYQSPKHGLVPLLHDVPGFTYIEIHKANEADELLGCIAVGRDRTEVGVRNCAPILNRIVAMMEQAADEGRDVFCVVDRTQR